MNLFEVGETLHMPSFCEYGMCHNLGSSTYQGYCNEYHMKRAWKLEQRLKSFEASSQTRLKGSVPQSLPSKAPSSTPQSKLPSQSPAS